MKHEPSSLPFPRNAEKRSVSISESAPVAAGSVSDCDLFAWAWTIGGVRPTKLADYALANYALANYANYALANYALANYATMPSPTVALAFLCAFVKADDSLCGVPPRWPCG